MVVVGVATDVGNTGFHENGAFGGGSTYGGYKFVGNAAFGGNIVFTVGGALGGEQYGIEVGAVGGNEGAGGVCHGGQGQGGD